MVSFATVDELADYLQTDFTTEDRIRATRLLEQASSIVQRSARQTFELVTDDSITLLPSRTHLLLLPELPVTGVTSVTANDIALAVADYIWTTSGLLYAATGRWLYETTVVYSHGYATIPDDIVSVTVAMAARAWNNPRGVLSEQIGTYSARYPNNRTGLSLLPDEEAIVTSYRPVPG